MKLSMWMLAAALAEYSPKINISGGAPVLTGVRLNNAEPDERDEFVVLRSSGAVLVLMNGEDRITLENTGVTEILNLCISLFESYADWDRRLQLASYSDAPFQAILNVAHEKFRCPMFFGQKNLRIYAITEQYPEAQVYEGWDEVKSIRTMPLRLQERVRNRVLGGADLQEDKQVAALPCAGDNSKRFDYQIRANCCLSGTLWGHLYIYYSGEVRPDILQLTGRVAGQYEALLDRTLINQPDRYSVYSYLVDILDGRKIEASSMSAPYRASGMSEKDVLALYKVSIPADSYARVNFDYLCESLSDRAAEEIVFPYAHSVIIISRFREERAKTLLTQIIPLVTLGNYHIGESLCFTGLENIYDAYFQAGYAIDHAPEQSNRVHSFKSVAFGGIARAFKATHNVANWIDGALHELIRLDSGGSSEYYKTLRSFLDCDAHLGNTAADLKIHRNTLMYRLKKIEDILQIDLYSNKDLAYLRFCCEFLRENGEDIG